MSLSVNLPTLEQRLEKQLLADLDDLEQQAGQVLAGSATDAGGIPPQILAAFALRHPVVATSFHLDRYTADLQSVPDPLAPVELHRACPLRPLTKAWLTTARLEAPAIAKALALQVETLAGALVPDDTRAAVIARDVISERWAWPMVFDRGPGWYAILNLRNTVRAFEPVKPTPEIAAASAKARAAFPDPSAAVLHRLSVPVGRSPDPTDWPAEIAFSEAVAWARRRLDHHLGPERAKLAFPRGPDGKIPEEEWRATVIWVPTAAQSPLSDHEGTGASLYPYHLGLLFLAWREVERDRRRPVLAVDAGRVHHGLVMGWEKAATNQKLTVRPQPDHVELLLPGQQQIALGIPGEAHEKLISALQGWRSATGLRTYITLLHLLSVRGARQGFVRWTLEDHLDVQGISRKERREATLRREAEEVALLTRMELAVRDGPNGRMREVRPLFIVGSRFERLHGSKWELDGMELQVNPLIWSGVRDPDSGKLGTNYGLGADGLPRLNPRTNPAALALGLLLPIRFRMALNEGKDFVELAGENVLPYTGLRYSARDPGRTWRALEDDLNQLQRIGGVSRWEWKNAGGPSIRNVLRFYMAEAHRDRMALGVRPVELPARPLTGDELRTWRSGKGLSQAKAATALRVGIATLKRAEKEPGELLGPALRDALHEALSQLREAPTMIP